MLELLTRTEKQRTQLDLFRPKLIDPLMGPTVGVRNRSNFDAEYVQVLLLGYGRSGRLISADVCMSHVVRAGSVETIRGGLGASAYLGPSHPDFEDALLPIVIYDLSGEVAAHRYEAILWFDNTPYDAPEEGDVADPSVRPSGF